MSAKKRTLMGETECTECGRTVKLYSDDLPDDLGAGFCCELIFVLQPDGRCDVLKRPKGPPRGGAELIE